MIIFSYVDANGRVAALSERTLVWRGQWSSTAAYQLFDWVSYKGDNFVALGTGTNITPTVPSTSWSLLLERNITGLPPGPSTVSVTVAPFAWTSNQLLDVKTFTAGGTVITVNGTVIFTGTASQGTNLGMVMLIYGTL